MGKHRTRAQWQALVDEFERSGVSQRAFCRRHEINHSTFCRWLYKLRKAAGDGALIARPASFVEVELPAEPARPLMQVRVGEVTVDFETLVPPAWVAELAACREKLRC